MFNHLKNPHYEDTTQFRTLPARTCGQRISARVARKMLAAATTAIQLTLLACGHAHAADAPYPPIPAWVQNDSAASAASAMPALPGAQLQNAPAPSGHVSLNPTPSEGVLPNAASPEAGQAFAVSPDAAQLRAAQARAKMGANGVPADPPTAFQRFVADSTGRTLPIFGQDLFSGADAGTYASVQNVPAPSDYVIGVGDEIQLQVWGGVDGNMTLTVDRNGQVNIPKVGAVTVAGVRAGELDSVLQRQIGRVFSNFKVNASLGRMRSIQVYVVGQARRPGAYTVSSLSTLVNALFASGGPGPNGSMRSIELRRGGALVATLDLYGFITSGRADGDMHLLPGDVIVIPSAGPRVALMGALDTPAIYELKPQGESLRQLLGYAGGTSALTSTDKVTIERVTDPTMSEPSRRVEERSLDSTGLASAVKDGDIVTLQKINPGFANAVTLRGNVAAPLRYPYRQGMKLSDLLPEPDALLTADYFKRKNVLVQFERNGREPTNDRPNSLLLQPLDSGRGSRLDRLEAGRDNRVENLVDEPNWNYAVIERLNRHDLTTELIPFNLGAIVHKTDSKADLALEPGDVVTIFGKKDMRLPLADHTRFVRVDGEVRAAGVYQLQPGDTLQTVLRRAGGLTSQAYVYGIEFTREQTREAQTQNLGAAIARSEQQSGAKLAAAIANMPTSADTKALQDQMAQEQRAQIARLRQLKPSGRMSLELATDAHDIGDLPDLPLDNGDAIYVPPHPAFVTVVGAVDNENALIWKPGRTVGDALRVAGVQQDIAEPDSAFVLRADGSVQNRDSMHWMSSFDSLKLMPGDTVVMPEKIDPRSPMTKFIAGLKDWSQVLANFGLGAAAIKVLR
ncbi:polysaccharide biosynthesis/export family protein [Paraburkholderia diazotrophica]|uniref:polysaccharide biosynthesis/export family protein n=1 Tax=Paraburkholderia diazotrophica TaxID=667676 RepID=UPI00317A32B2